MIEIVQFLMGKQKFQWGDSRKHGGESFNFKLGGETDFLSWSTSYAGGAMFQRGHYWGVYLMTGRIIKIALMNVLGPFSVILQL